MARQRRSAQHSTSRLMQHVPQEQPCCSSSCSCGCPPVTFTACRSRCWCGGGRCGRAELADLGVAFSDGEGHTDHIPTGVHCAGSFHLHPWRDLLRGTLWLLVSALMPGAGCSPGLSVPCRLMLMCICCRRVQLHGTLHWRRVYATLKPPKMTLPKQTPRFVTHRIACTQREWGRCW